MRGRKSVAVRSMAALSPLGDCVRVILSLVLCAAVSLAQDTPPSDHAPATAERQVTPAFQSKVNLVLAPVVVRDAHGRPVGNLTKDEFQLFDNGKRQTIASFAMVKRANTEPPDKTATPAADSKLAGIAAADARPERYVIYLFDDLNTDFADMAAVREAAARHLKRSFAATDRAAIYTVSGHPMLDFTGDLAKLEDTVSKLKVQLAVGHGGTECPDISYFLADLILNKGDDRAHRAVMQRTVDCAHVPQQTAEAIAAGAERRELQIGEQDTRVALRTLRAAIRRLAEMPGQRSIVMASPGFFVRTPQGISAMADLLRQAAEANVIIGAVDARGLHTLQPDGSRLAPPSKLWQEYSRMSAQASNDVMCQLAEGTGGAFFHNNNDLAEGFERVAAAPEFSYVLGFSPAGLKENGSFHSLKIRLPNEKGVSIEARRGYYAVKREAAEQAARPDIDDLVFSREEMSGIPVGLRTWYSKSEGGQAKLTVMAVVDVRSLHFQKIDGRNRDLVTLVAALFDQDGSYVTGTTKTVNLGLRDETLEHIGSEITVPSEFHVKPGTYGVRLVVRDTEGKAMSACNGAVTIP